MTLKGISTELWTLVRNWLHHMVSVGDRWESMEHHSVEISHKHQSLSVMNFVGHSRVTSFVLTLQPVSTEFGQYYLPSQPPPRLLSVPTFEHGSQLGHTVVSPSDVSKPGLYLWFSYATSVTPENNVQYGIVSSFNKTFITYIIIYSRKLMEVLLEGTGRKLGLWLGPSRPLPVECIHD